MTTFPAPASLRSAGACGGFVNALTATGTGLRGIPSPRELGLPAKFTEFRPVQIEALEKILASPKRWILLQAPTGTGKTLIAAALQKLTRKPMLYTCVTKDLQDQFCKDFPYAVELKGRDNYKTAFYPKISCALCMKSKKSPRCKWCCPPDCYWEAPCERGSKDYECLRECPYEVQKARALAAPLAVLNTAIFLNEANYVGGFSGNKHWIVFDEADLLEKELMSFIEVSVSPKLIEELGLQPPDRKTVEEAWIEWMNREAIPKVTERLKQLEEEKDWKTISLDELRELQELTRVKAKLEFFRHEMEATMWANCTEDMENGPWVWKPVFVSRYAEKRLWRHGTRFLLMSATILEPKQFCRNLGIPYEDAEYIELPSIFPKENRPIYFVPSADMTHKQKEAEWPKLVEALDTVLDLHPDEKTLVHSVSYALARYIYANSRHKDRMVIYNDTAGRTGVLERYKESEDPLVIVAPSLERGIDLRDDLCRVVIIAKVPYRDLSDEQVRKRLYSARDGRAWYSVDAVRTIVQMSGRGVRHDGDWAVTYILDAQFGRLYKEWKRAFPGWWREALKTITLKMLEEV